MQRFVPYLLALFIVAALLRVDFFFTIVYLLLIVYILSRLWVRHTTSRLEIRRRFTDHAFCGDNVTVDLMVRNTSRLPIPWLEIRESLPSELRSPPFHHEVISLGGREHHRFQYRLGCRKRGYYAIGPLTAQSGDLLGITPRSRRKATPEHIIVYPRVIPLQELGLPTHSPLAALPASAPLFEDPARVLGVRDYQKGDRPRRIHWTATARTGRLLVKRYQPAIARETFVCLDLNREAYGQRQWYLATELAIVIAASVANHIAVNEKLPVGLNTEGFDPLTGSHHHFHLPPRRERAHLMNLLEVLARVQVAPATPLVSMLRRESVNLSWGATILAITGSESQELFDTLVHLKRGGFAVSLVLVQPAQASPHLRKQASVLQVPVHRVWKERDVEVWL
jgi:uncharacterized protein (DUF58 family)